MSITVTTYHRDPSPLEAVGLAFRLVGSGIKIVGSCCEFLGALDRRPTTIVTTTRREHVHTHSDEDVVAAIIMGVALVAIGCVGLAIAENQ